MEFLEIIQNCSQILGIFIRFLDFSIRFLFEISAKVYKIFSSDTPLAVVNRIDGLETHKGYNISHYLCFCSGLCRNEDLYRYVLIVFLSN